MKVLPVYLSVKNRLLKEIEDKPVNTPIHSERDLADHYQCSRMTVRKAIDELVDEGILYREKNRGTFVAERKLLKKNTLIEGLQNAAFDDFRIIYYGVKPADPLIAPHLGVSTNEMILRVVRVKEELGCPQSVEEIYYIRNRIPDDVAGELDKLLDLDQAIREGSITQKFRPMEVPPQYVNFLGVRNHVPIIMVESTIMSKNGSPIVYIREFNHPEKVIEITS